MCLCLVQQPTSLWLEEDPGPSKSSFPKDNRVLSHCGNIPGPEQDLRTYHGLNTCGTSQTSSFQIPQTLEGLQCQVKVAGSNWIKPRRVNEGQDHHTLKKIVLVNILSFNVWFFNHSLPSTASNQRSIILRTKEIELSSKWKPAQKINK